jgi:transcriptional regulator GlxA family with amidase domain
MRIAIITFDGFNEIDTFVPLGLLNRLSARGWRAEITGPTSHITSMNGVTVQAQQPLEFANEADAVIFGSGIYTRAIAADIGKRGALLDRLQLDPLRQLIGGQCSGTLLMARLGLLADLPACTDSNTKPWVLEAGVRVVDLPFQARGPLATAGGCLASQYLAAWVIAKGAGLDAATQALQYAAPVGEKDAYAERVLNVIRPFLPETTG